MCGSSLQLLSVCDARAHAGVAANRFVHAQQLEASNGSLIFKLQQGNKIQVHLRQLKAFTFVTFTFVT